MRRRESCLSLQFAQRTPGAIVGARSADHYGFRGTIAQAGNRSARLRLRRPTSADDHVGALDRDLGALAKQP